LSAFLADIAGALLTTQSMRVDPEVSEVDPVTGLITGVVGVTTATDVGESSGVPVSQATMVLVRWRTGEFVAGREIRGRTFIPGIAGAAVTSGGELASANAIVFQNAADDLIANSGLGVWSPKNGQIEVATSASIWNEFAVLRSRRD
jgi:hypothetical protein